MKPAAIAAWLVGALPWAAAAQQVASPFERLASLVSPGDRIEVTEASGRTVSGSVISLSSSSLAIQIANGRRVLAVDDVRTIWRRRSDPLANGTLLGLVIGGGLGLAQGLSPAEIADNDGKALFAPALVYGAVGAGIGAGVDSFIKSRQLIYMRSAVARSWIVVPTVMRDHRALAVSLQF